MIWEQWNDFIGWNRFSATKKRKQNHVVKFSCIAPNSKLKLKYQNPLSHPVRARALRACFAVACPFLAKYPFIASQEQHDFVSCINYIIISIHTANYLDYFYNFMCTIYVNVTISFIIAIYGIVISVHFCVFCIINVFLSFCFTTLHYTAAACGCSCFCIRDHALFFAISGFVCRFKFNNGNLCKPARSFIKTHTEVLSLSLPLTQCV